MTSEVITDIGELSTLIDGEPRMAHAAVLIENGRVAWIGAAASAPAADSRVSVSGRAILPGWVDSHTHLVFAGDRSSEFEARMAGLPYSAGGITATVTDTRAATTEQLRGTLCRLRDEALTQGTTFLETKTGYGLDIDTERRSAQLASEVADVVTFLGAHVVPDGLDVRDYLDRVTGPMLSAVREYVDFIDVFCEVGAFDVEQSREVLRAGKRAGLGLRVHGNQLGHSGGVTLAVEFGAASVDHCNFLTSADVETLAGSHTVATVLPACDLSTRQPFAPARQLLDAGATLAIATNCNPGSSYTTSMQFCVATAVLQMNLTVEEAIRAATRGGARSLGRDHEQIGRSEHAVGALFVGGRADLQVLDAPSVSHIAYRPGVSLIAAVWRNGVRTTDRRPSL